MELSELKDKIVTSFTGTKNDLDNILYLIEEDKSIFPFNEYEHLICTLIGQYDLWLDGIKIEVKASRAVDSDSDEPLYVKALSRKFNQYELKDDNLEKAIRDAYNRKPRG